MDAVRSEFLETNEFMDSALKEENKKEKITADEVIFLLLNLQKKLAWINIFVLDLVPYWLLFVYRCEGLGR